VTAGTDPATAGSGARRKFDASIAACAGYETFIVRAGYRGKERIVPPAGEDHAFEIERWARRVEVSVSPTGRSVRVWVDGKEVRNSDKPGGAA